MSTISHRSYEQGDYERIRNLLIETVPLTPARHNWSIRRWDGNFYHRETLPSQAQMSERVHVWQTADRLIGVVHPEGDGDAHFQYHPDYRPDIEEEMLRWAENNLARPNSEGRQQLEVFAFEYDSPRRRLLEQHGFEKTKYGGVTRKLRFGKRPFSPPNLHPDYTLRTTTAAQADYDHIAALLNASFNRDIHNGNEICNFMTQSPSFEHALDLVAVAPDGTFAAYVGMMYDKDNRSAEFEPVCTHPDHQRKGLARALMLDGLHSLNALGARDVFVDTGDQVAANKLYEAVGFTEAYKGYVWQKKK